MAVAAPANSALRLAHRSAVSSRRTNRLTASANVGASPNIHYCLINRPSTFSLSGTSAAGSVANLLVYTCQGVQK